MPSGLVTRLVTPPSWLTVLEQLPSAESRPVLRTLLTPLSMPPVCGRSTKTRVRRLPLRRPYSFLLPVSLGYITHSSEVCHGARLQPTPLRTTLTPRNSTHSKQPLRLTSSHTLKV